MATGSSGKAHYVVVVSIVCKGENVTEFLKATMSNAEGTRKEPGNLRFDVLRATEDPCKFTLYEAYRTPEDFASHQKTQHYLAWRSAVADFMAVPRVGLKHNALFFD